jgi:tetratricopeptide (TPR) repeat protein
MLTSNNNLGLVLSSQGKYKEAKVMHQQVLIAKEKVLGAKHLDILASVNNLGNILESQGRYKKAKSIH